MSKPGLELANLGPLLKSAHGGWSLCVGAGTSLPMFPSWNALVERLTAKIDTNAVSDDIAAVQQLFSPDALIQAARVRSNLGVAEFSQLLAEQLYRDFLGPLGENERAVVLDCLAVSHAAAQSRARWTQFLEIARRLQWTSSSAFAIADVLQRTLGTPLQPAGVLSFNAEPLLLTFLHAFESTRAANAPSRRIDRITHAASNRFTDRVAYVFCHGLLPIPGQSAESEHLSLDKLVFSESEYLSLASSTFSWQSSAFFEMAVHRRVVFVGVSLSDPNMRRWLASIHSNRIEELAARGGAGDSTQHLWLNREPRSAVQRTWVEASVAHLGVRLVWLPSWDATGLALARLLGL